MKSQNDNLLITMIKSLNNSNSSIQSRKTKSSLQTSKITYHQGDPLQWNSITPNYWYKIWIKSRRITVIINSKLISNKLYYSRLIQSRHRNLLTLRMVNRQKGFKKPMGLEILASLPYLLATLQMMINSSKLRHLVLVENSLILM